MNQIILPKNLSLPGDLIQDFDPRLGFPLRKVWREANGCRFVSILGSQTAEQFGARLDENEVRRDRRCGRDGAPAG